MNRHIEREKSMICLYQALLTNRDLKIIAEDIFLVPLDEISEFSQTLMFNSFENKERYIDYINQVLDKWTFERLSYVDQAILLMGCTEFDQKTADAAIIIDEAILLSKKYSDEEAYKVINGVLDNL